MTQIELAEKLNYSDKAVSKWERGESLPDITVIKSVADIFGVTVDYLLEGEHNEVDFTLGEVTDAERAELRSKRKRKHIMITGMSMLLVFLVATIVFIVIDIAVDNVAWHWISFVYAFWVSMIVWLVFNSIWFNKRRNYLIVSLLTWALICSVHLTVLGAGFNIWQIYLLGIPGQLIIVLWSIIGKKS